MINFTLFSQFVWQGLVMKKGGKEEKNNNKPLVTLHEEGSEERIKVANI